jgi:hypothetical protein
MSQKSADYSALFLLVGDWFYDLVKMKNPQEGGFSFFIC